MPSYYLSTFEEAFYTGFFTLDTSIFGPEVSQLSARYIAYTAMEEAHPFLLNLSAPGDLEFLQRWHASMKLITERQTQRRAHVGTT